MSDRVEDTAVTTLIVLGSLAALSLAVWVAWAWWSDDPFGLDGIFKGE